MADPYNRLAMFSAPVADDQVNMLAQPQLPPGHPSNMLMWLRDQIPQIQADDSSTMSGVTSRVGRTVTAIPRAGLETMSNWLLGTHDPNAVRIGEDTIAPLGLGAFAGFAGKAMAPSRDVRIARELAQAHPEEVTVGRMYRTPYSVGLTSPDGMHLQRGRGELQRAGEGGGTVVTRPDPEVYGVADNVNMRGPHLLADNARSSVPGTVVNAMGEQRGPGMVDATRYADDPQMAARAYRDAFDDDPKAAARYLNYRGKDAENLTELNAIQRPLWPLFNDDLSALPRVFPPATKRSNHPGDGGMNLHASTASAPGLAANSTQQDDGVSDIFRRFGLVE